VADTAKIVLNIFDGTRKPVGPELNTLVTLRDGNQHQLHRDYHAGPAVEFDVPFYNNFGDNYTVIAYANKYAQAGFTPVKVSPHTPQIVDLMLLPKKGNFDFADAEWGSLSKSQPELISILSQGASAADARKRYADLMSNDPKSLACLLNIATAMRAIHLPDGTPLDYLKGLRWDGKSIRPDRFFAYCDKKLIDQVRLAVSHGTFAPEPGFELFHKGATSSYKEVQFGEGNVQLSFHENDPVPEELQGCVIVESDIDYYKDPAAHALLEVIPNHFGGPTDPKTAYALRWIAGRRAGVAPFNPPYVIA
jgi:hypothetical protein